MQIAGNTFSVWALVGGFVFSTFGIFVFKHGKQEMNLRRLAIGITLLGYPFFVPNPWACWGIGLFLVGANYFSSWVNSG